MASEEWREGSYEVGRLGEESLSGYSPTEAPAVNISPYALDPNYLPKGPEFIFPVEARQKSWNEKWFDRVGTSYISGLVVGGAWGLWEGVANVNGKTFRMRATGLVNGLTRRGPFMANTLGVIALMYSPLESVIGHYRGTQDTGNSVAAAAITGVLYKSTAGLRAMGVAGAAGCAIIGVLTLSKYAMGQRMPSVFNYT